MGLSGYIHYFLQMSLEEYLVTGVLEIGTLHAMCHSPVYDICLLMQEELVQQQNQKGSNSEICTQFNPLLINFFSMGNHNVNVSVACDVYVRIKWV